MKKLGILALLLSLSALNFGCSGAADDGAATNGETPPAEAPAEGEGAAEGAGE